MSRDTEPRWDKMTSKQRALHLVKEIDMNTRGLAKVSSALVYLGTDCGLNVTQDAPRLYQALHDVVLQRRNLRGALEAELKTQKVRGNR